MYHSSWHEIDLPWARWAKRNRRKCGSHTFQSRSSSLVFTFSTSLPLRPVLQYRSLSGKVVVILLSHSGWLWLSWPPSSCHWRAGSRSRARLSNHRRGHFLSSASSSGKRKQKKKWKPYLLVVFLKFGVQFCHFSISLLECSSVIVHYLGKLLGFFSLVLDGCPGLLFLFRGDHAPIAEAIIFFLDLFQSSKEGYPIFKILCSHQNGSVGISSVWISQQKPVITRTTHRSDRTTLASLLLMSGIASHLAHAEVYPMGRFDNWLATLGAFWKLSATLGSPEPWDTCCAGFVS